MIQSLKSQLPFLWVAVAKTFHNINPMSLTKLTSLCQDNPKFLYQTLPQLGKDLDRALEVGQFHLTPGFFKKLKGACYPVFLKEYFNKIFWKDGYIKDDFDPSLIRELRTLCYFFYKFEQPFSPEMEADAYKKFKDTDLKVKTSFTSEQIFALKGIIKDLLPDDPFDIRPRHSNGATADSYSNLQKRLFKRYIPSLMSVYGPEYFFNGLMHGKHALSLREFETSEPNSKVTLVPKDSRGPRIICMEPHERMFIQKGIMHKLYDHIENYSPARGRINFSDQTINQRLAYESSISRKNATIDLKDASDLVSWELVKQVFPPDWVDALTATRSAFADLPGETVALNKFAPMGSALCFPIEAIIFYAIARLESPDVWVYGDDIIVPTETVVRVMDKLESYGLIINREKSLYRGSFRESCGGDYFRGYNITPIRCKSVDLESTYAFANNLADAFTNKTGEACILWYESIVPEVLLRLPFRFRERTSLLAFFTENSNEYLLLKKKYDSDIQINLYRGICTKQNATSFHQIDDMGYDMLFDYFTSSSKDLSPNSDRFYRELTSEWNYNHRKSTGMQIQEFINSSLVSTSAVFKEVKTSLGYQWVALQL